MKIEKDIEELCYVLLKIETVIDCPFNRGSHE